MARPRKEVTNSKRVTVCLTPAEFTDLARQAAEQDLGVSAYVRRLLRGGRRQRAAAAG